MILYVHNLSKMQTTLSNLSTSCLEKIPENTPEWEEGTYSTMTTILQSSFPAELWLSEGNTAFAVHDSLDLWFKNPSLSICIFLPSLHVVLECTRSSGLSVDLSFQSMYFSFFYISGLNQQSTCLSQACEKVLQKPRYKPCFGFLVKMSPIPQNMKMS